MTSCTNATPRGDTAQGSPRPSTSRPGGILQPAVQQRYVTTGRTAADLGLDPWLEWYWTVRWDLPAGTSYDAAVLTHPSVNIAIESGHGPRHGFAMPAALVHGVVTRGFSVGLQGEGRVFGVKFRPGGFSAFTGLDPADLTDRVVRLADVFGDAAARFQADTLSADDDTDRVAVADALLLERRPEIDPRYEQLLSSITAMVADRRLTSVEQVAEHCGVGSRTLQRLFRRYVGVGPKWVLQRYRLLDAARLIDEGRAPDLAVLAAELGWYDQSHFSRDFAQVVGMPPGAYAAAAARASS
ncbi:MAG TPA: helix-turn-helix transcriptional regulator [Mycobacteriales bacterium]|nr:helix-turn-helix transcriptional regulator [Mycobacteriales bacterium]